MGNSLKIVVILLALLFAVNTCTAAAIRSENEILIRNLYILVFGIFAVSLIPFVLVIIYLFKERKKLKLGKGKNNAEKVIDAKCTNN